MFLLGVYCVAGAYLFIYLEYPLEDREHQVVGVVTSLYT